MPASSSPEASGSRDVRPKAGSVEETRALLMSDGEVPQ